MKIRYNPRPEIPIADIFKKDSVFKYMTVFNISKEYEAYLNSSYNNFLISLEGMLKDMDIQNYERDIDVFRLFADVCDDTLLKIIKEDYDISDDYDESLVNILFNTLVTSILDTRITLHYTYAGYRSALYDLAYYKLGRIKRVVKIPQVPSFRRPSELYNFLTTDSESSNYFIERLNDPLIYQVSHTKRLYDIFLTLPTMVPTTNLFKIKSIPKNSDVTLNLLGYKISAEYKQQLSKMTTASRNIYDIEFEKSELYREYLS